MSDRTRRQLRNGSAIVAVLAWMALCAFAYAALANTTAEISADNETISEATPITLSLFLAGMGGAASLTWFLARQKSNLLEKVDVKIAARIQPVEEALARHEEKDRRRAGRIFRELQALREMVPEPRRK